MGKTDGEGRRLLSPEEFEYYRSVACTDKVKVGAGPDSRAI
jgi:hypothetical protein